MSQVVVQTLLISNMSQVMVQTLFISNMSQVVVKTWLISYLPCNKFPDQRPVHKRHGNRLELPRFNHEDTVVVIPLFGGCPRGMWEYHDVGILVLRGMRGILMLYYNCDQYY